MNASPGSDFAAADPHRGRAAFKAARPTIQTGWPAPVINPTTRPFPALNPDRHLPRAASPGELGELPEDTHELGRGVPDHPSPDDRTLVIDQAHPCTAEPRSHPQNIC